jgi:acyl-CoA reductase-like NAD-dependent aldehyde dehydrogenase
VNDVPRNQANEALVERGAEAPVAETFVPISPGDLRPLAPVRASTVEDVRTAVSRARAAQEFWRQRPLSERIALLEKAAVEMLKRRAEVIESARLEMGKVEAEGLFNEALGPLETVRGWAKVVKRATRTRAVRLNPLSFPKKRAQVDYLPRGVVGVIAPWNYPASGLYRSIFPALMTGNGVVLKPSEYTPLADMLPAGLVQSIQGDGRVGAALIDAGIDACVFTGSPRSGRKVRLQCADRGIPSSIEMGGKDPAIVLADCDLPRTVAGLTHWALSNAGQACGAVEVAYVDQSIADELVERLRRAWVKLRADPGELADIGPLANRRQLEVVVAQVEDARTKGAKVVCGGAPTGPGLWFPATLLDHCDNRMSIVNDETFGPVLAVVRVTGAAEAIRAANEGRYGLGASIWTSDLDRARRLAERLDVGVITVNNHAFSGAIPALPWSGTRETGFGVANGIEALPTFVRPRTLIVDASRSREPFWMPFDRTLWDLGEILAELQLGRLGRAWRLPFLWRKRVKTIRDFFS